MRPRTDLPAPSVPAPTPTAATIEMYLDGERIPGQRSYAEALKVARIQGGIVWLCLTEPTAEILNDVAAIFGLHPLAVEDAIHGDQRPKLEEFGETSFMVLKTATYVEHERLTATSEVVDTGELMIFVGQHFVITVQRGPDCHLDEVRKSIDADDEKLLVHGPWAAVYAIVDAVVDEYVAVTSGVRDDIDQVEETIFESRRSGDVQRIYKLNREVMELRRAVTPLGRPLTLLSSLSPEAGAPDVPMDLRPLFRDVQDHVARVVDLLNSYDALLDSVISASLAEIGIRQNEDMRKISAWVAIAAVQTLIAGVYGMNFRHMPELNWVLGYPFALTIMLTSAVVLYRAFRRNKWL